MTLFDPEKITYFAKTDARGQFMPFGIKAKDRQRHMYVIGKTGMGKSTLLENMAAQDILNGEGMAFIDPHGSAAETLLEYVPEHRVNDVVYFAPFDLEHPIAFNVMEDVGADKSHLVVSGLMSTFKKIWVDAWSARMEYILTNALLALIEYPDTTLLSVNRMFVDKEFREKVVAYIKDPAVKAYWTDEFANYTERFAAEALPAIQNKIGQFTGNPIIRNVIGQPHSSFDIRKMMDEKKILIMNLSKGLIGETNANLLGSMLTTRIYLAAMSRADLPVDVMKKMPNFYFYVDEFQSFANSTFANILSEARKYHLNLIIAHQYVDQMEEDVRSAVFGNVGTTIAFRVGPFDAEVLETVFAPQFTAIDLVNLGFAQIYLSLMIDGVGSQPFSAITLPPLTRPPVSCRGMVLEASRKNYGNVRSDVEKIVADLHTPLPPKEKPERKGDARKANGPSPSGQGNQHKKPLPKQTYDNPRSLPAAESRPALPPKEPSHKKMDDMRSILSKLSQDNEQSKPVPAKKSEEKTGESSHRVDLKNALASVLQQTHTPATPPPAPPTPTPPPKQTVPSPQPVPQPKVAPPPPRSAPATPQHFDDDEINELAKGIDEATVKRMLRDHQQERSPFA
ncbi:MAG TPA: type IV secretion system DNA-binding domain-containing protein [Candidatus Paceibacterota bacterium]